MQTKNRIKFRWYVPVLKKESKHELFGKKWTNTWELHSKRILQYSLDGDTWYDVECTYVEINPDDAYKYKWDKEIHNLVQK